MILLWIIIGVAGRLIIHVPDATPLTALCLFAPSVFSKRLSFAVIAAILVLSDIGLHYLCGYPIFGYWSLFTYSGWFAVVLLGFLLINKIAWTRGLLLSVVASLVFWVWTNLGVWCTSGLYLHTPQGLIDCYIAALPFLKNMILSSVAGMIVCTLALTCELLQDFFSRLQSHHRLPAAQTIHTPNTLTHRSH